MRILHLIQRYPPARGGAEQQFHEWSWRLAAAGHEVVVATSDALDFELFWQPDRRRVAVPEERMEGVQVRRFPVQHLPASTVAYPAVRRLLWMASGARGVPTAWMDRLARLTPHLPTLYRWLDQTDEPFDLVGAMTICFEPLFEAGLALARRRGIPFVAHPLTHLGAGPAPAQDELSRFYTMRHQRRVVHEADLVVAQSEAERRFYLDDGADPARVEVVGSGVTPAALEGGNGERFRRRHGLSAPIVLYVGSLARDKGAEDVVEAVRRLWRAGRTVELVLIGARLAPFEAFLARLPAADRQRIRLLGAVDDDEKRDALAAATLFAMPSRTDSFGIAYVEAWCYGKPVIAAQTWGVTDLVTHGEDGLCVPFGDPDALAAAMTTLLDDPALAAAMGARGRAKVPQHTWERKGARVVELYEGLGDKGGTMME